MPLIAGTGTSCFFLHFAIIPGVFRHRNHFLGNEHFATGRAMAAFGQAGCGAGRRNRGINDFDMAQCVNDFLGNQGFAAHRAVLAFRQTGFGTGGGNCSINDFSMTQCVNDFLGNQDLATDRAALTLGQAGFGTGRCDRIQCFLSMRKLFDRDNHGFATTATGAGVLSFTFLAASGCLDHIAIIPRMAQRGNNFSFFFQSAATAKCTGRQAIFRTSSFLCRFIEPSMTQCIRFFRVGITTTRASVSIQSHFCTGSRSGHFTHIIVTQCACQFLITDCTNLRSGAGCGLAGGMAQGGDLRSRSADLIVTDRAVNNCIVGARNSTGGFNGILLHCLAGSMAQSIHNRGHTGQFLTTHCTVNNRIVAAVIGAVRINLILGDRLAFAVRNHRNRFLCLQHTAAGRTLFTIGQAGFGTSSCLTDNNFRRMAQRRNLLRIGVTTDRAGVGHNTGRLTLGVPCYLAFIAVGNLVHIAIHHNIAAARTGMGGIALGGTGRRGYNIFVSVAQGSSLIRSIGLAAERAGIGGIALFGTGGLGNRSFVLMLQSSDFLGFNRIAAGAIAVLRTGLLTCGFFIDDPLAIVMAQGVHIGILLNMVTTIALTGMGGVTLFGTSGIRNHGLKIVAQRINLLGFKRIAAGAVAAFYALIQTIGSRFNRPFAEVMAQGGLFIVSIAVTAARAGIGGVTIFLAGSRGDNRHIVVLQSLDCFGFYLTAAGAGALLLTGNAALGLCGNLPLAPSMVKGIGLISNIAVTAAGAGIGGIAALSTGRSSHNSIVAVIQRGDRCVLAGNNILTHQAADHRIVTAVSSTASSNLILNCCIAGSVLQHRSFFLCLCDRAANRTLSTRCQASCRTGSGHSRNDLFLVVQLRNRRCNTAGFLAANGTVNHGVVAAVSSTGSVHIVLDLCCTGSMALRLHSGSLTGNLSAAVFYGTVNHGIVAAVGSTGSVNIVLDHCSTGGMAQGIQFIMDRRHDSLTHRAVNDHVESAFLLTGRRIVILLDSLVSRAVALSRSFRLCLDHSAADRAVLAFGQARLSTGGILCGVHNFGVAQSVDDLLFGFPGSADGALAAVGQTGLGTGGNLARDGFIVMAGSGYSSGFTGKLRGTNRTVDHSVIAAVRFTGDLLLVFGHGLACSMAGSGDHNTFRNTATALTYIVAVASFDTVSFVVDDQFTVGMAQCGDHGLNDFVIAAGALLAGSQAVLGTGSSLTGSRGQIMAQSGNFFHHRCVQGVALGIHTAASCGLGAGFRTGGFLGHGGGIQTLASGSVPHAVGIEVGTGSIGCSFQVGTVRILQLGRGDGNLIIGRCSLAQLIGHRLSAGLHHNLCTLGAGNGSTALGGVDITIGYIHKSLDNNGRIAHILNGTCKVLAGGIRDKN